MHFTHERFPTLEGPLRELATQHREISDGPLHLALAFDPGRVGPNVFLFEVLGGFGRDEVSPDRELFEVSFGATDTLPLAKGQRLHLILTSPTELRAALFQEWPSVEEVRDAIHRGDFEVLYQDELGDDLMRLLNDRA
jgi:hypothetical protein